MKHGNDKGGQALQFSWVPQGAIESSIRADWALSKKKISGSGSDKRSDY